MNQFSIVIDLQHSMAPTTWPLRSVVLISLNIPSKDLL